MKRRCFALVVALVINLLSVNAEYVFAGGKGSSQSSGKSSSGSSHSSGGSVHVKGYTRKDGTYVSPHDRSLPGTASHSGSSSGLGSTSHSSSTSKSTSSTLNKTSTAHNSSRHYSNSKSTYSNSRPAPGYRSSPTYIGARDSHGRLARSESAKEAFMRQSGYPHGRPGYVVDHINPLKRGGADEPSNMQWQTIADAKAKDKWE